MDEKQYLQEGKY
ncbi:unnamed protein product [Debaryomyces fabryi]|nr:unnamed protein product [Debaryomyces fabryi]